MGMADMLPERELMQGGGHRAKKVSVYGLRGAICPACGAEFYPTPAHGWTIGGRKFCSYHCMRAAERGTIEKKNEKKQPATRREIRYRSVLEQMQSIEGYGALRRGKQGKRIRECEEKIRALEKQIMHEGTEPKERTILQRKRWYWQRALLRAVDVAKWEAKKR